MTNAGSRKMRRGEFNATAENASVKKKKKCSKAAGPIDSQGYF